MSLECQKNIVGRLNNFSLFFICAYLLIFFYFPPSDWLQQRAAFYDILTAVQKCHFFANIDRSEKLSFEVENRQKIRARRFECASIMVCRLIS